MKVIGQYKKKDEYGLIENELIENESKVFKIGKEDYYLYKKNERDETSKVIGKWYARRNECSVNGEDCKIVDYDKILLKSISEKIVIKSFKLMSTRGRRHIKKLNLPIIGCYVTDKEEEEEDCYDESDVLLIVFVNENPEFIIMQHYWREFSRMDISKDDKYIVLEWSRYVVVFDIEKKKCIYISDHEGTSSLGFVNHGFAGVISVYSNECGVTVKHKVMDEEDDIIVVTVSFYGVQ